MIKDSGNRTEFESGAVRDIQEGKGRCDLLPLEVVANIYEDMTDKTAAPYVFDWIDKFMNTGNEDLLSRAIEIFLLNDKPYDCNWSTLFLEVAVHFEEGAKKYGDRNWEKGIPVQRYIDSGLRHYLKYLRGDNDERHDRAFVWNMICAIWTCIHRPELNEYLKELESDEQSGSD